MDGRVGATGDAADGSGSWHGSMMHGRNGPAPRRTLGADGEVDCCLRRDARCPCGLGLDAKRPQARRPTWSDDSRQRYGRHGRPKALRHLQPDWERRNEPPELWTCSSGTEALHRLRPVRAPTADQYGVGAQKVVGVAGRASNPARRARKERSDPLRLSAGGREGRDAARVARHAGRRDARPTHPPIPIARPERHRRQHHLDFYGGALRRWGVERLAWPVGQGFAEKRSSAARVRPRLPARGYVVAVAPT